MSGGVPAPAGATDWLHPGTLSPGCPLPAHQGVPVRSSRPGRAPNSGEHGGCLQKAPELPARDVCARAGPKTSRVVVKAKVRSGGGSGAVPPAQGRFGGWWRETPEAATPRAAASKAPSNGTRVLAAREASGRPRLPCTWVGKVTVTPGRCHPACRASMLPVTRVLCEASRGQCPLTAGPWSPRRPLQMGSCPEAQGAPPWWHVPVSV